MVPNSGALWGTSKFDKGWEGQMGRKFDIVHVYKQWSQSFPNDEERALAAEGRLLLINWKSPGSWPAVANGSQDAQIATTANRLKAFGRKVFLAFHHEPENDIGGAGQPADYARAFRRVDGFNKAGANNVIFVWNMMGFVGGHGDIYPTCTRATPTSTGSPTTPTTGTAARPATSPGRSPRSPSRSTTGRPPTPRASR